MIKPLSLNTRNAEICFLAYSAAALSQKLTDVEGLYSAWPDRGSLVPFISAAALEELLPTLESEMIPKMEEIGRAHV